MDDWYRVIWTDEATFETSIDTQFFVTRRRLLGQSTIKHPSSHNENRFLRGQIYYKAKKLRNNGRSVVCRWVPGHAGLVGNEKADLEARNRAKKGGNQAERWGSLAYIKKNVT